MNNKLGPVGTATIVLGTLSALGLTSYTGAYLTGFLYGVGLTLLVVDYLQPAAQPWEGVGK